MHIDYMKPTKNFIQGKKERKRSQGQIQSLSGNNSPWYWMWHITYELYYSILCVYLCQIEDDATKVPIQV